MDTAARVAKAVVKLRHWAAAVWLGVTGHILHYHPAPALHDQDLDQAMLCLRQDRPAQALPYLVKSSGSGNPQAQYQLAELYVAGIGGLRRDSAQARDWLLRAARQGHWAAMAELGRIFEDGWGVPRDYIQAGQWYDAAKHADGDKSHAAWHENNIERAGRLAGRTLRDALKDEEKAMSALGPTADGMRRAAGLFEAGASTQAVAALQDMASAPAAEGLLGYLRAEGVGVRQDEAEAVRLLHRAAKAGDARSQEQLGSAYDAGIWGLRRSTEQALGWYQKATDQGDNVAMSRLCALYLRLDGMQRLNDGSQRMAPRPLFCFRHLARRGDESALVLVSLNDAAGLTSSEVKSGRLGSQASQAVQFVGMVGAAAGLVALTPVATVQHPAAGVAVGAMAVVTAAEALPLLIPMRQPPKREEEFLAGDPSVRLADLRRLRGTDAARLRVLRGVAKSGEVRAQRLLALAYLEGAGAPRDEERGLEWLRKAAAGGDAPARCRLGAWHAAQGTSEDFIEAYKWTMLGCAQQAEAIEKVLTVSERDAARRRAAAKP